MSNKDNTTESQEPRVEDQTNPDTENNADQAAADAAFDEQDNSQFSNTESSETESSKTDSSKTTASETSPSKKASPTSSHKKSNKKKGSGTKTIKWFIFLILLAAVAYAIFFGWQKWQDYQANINKADRVDQLEEQLSLQQHSFETKMSKQMDFIREISTDLEQNQRHISQLQDQLRTTQRKFQTLNSEKQQDWLFNEAEYLIREASYKLNFTDDAASIVALLQAADNQLAELNDGSLTQLRQTISQDISAIRGSGNLDIEGVAIAIETLKQNLSTLELASVQLNTTAAEPTDTTTEADISSWQHFKNSMSEAASRYYTVHQFDESKQPFISPQKDRLLRENILLNLQTAQLAALQNNQSLFQSNLNNVQQWVEQYFKQKPATTQAFLEQLKELQNSSVELDLPSSLQSYSAISDISQRKVNRWLNSSDNTQSEAQESDDTNEEEPSA